MKIAIENTSIEDVKYIHPQVFRDKRGFFLESYREDVWHEAGLDIKIVQANHSGSAQNVLRGLHFQWDPPMGKLMRVIFGKAFLVAVDIRRNSPTLGRWEGRILEAETPLFFWAPAGFARGFVVLSDFAEIQYFATGTYNADGESGILWNDPEVGIDWPVSNPILSDKDTLQMPLATWLEQPESHRFET